MLKRFAVAVAVLVVAAGVAVQCSGSPALGYAAPRIVAMVPDPRSTLRDMDGETWYVTEGVQAGQSHRLGIVVTNPGKISVTLSNVGFGWDGFYLQDFAPALVGSGAPPYSLDRVRARTTVTLAPGAMRLFVLPSTYKCTPSDPVPGTSRNALVVVKAEVRFRNAIRQVEMRLPIPDGVTPGSCQS